MSKRKLGDKTITGIDWADKSPPVLISIWIPDDDSNHINKGTEIQVFAPADAKNGQDAWTRGKIKIKVKGSGKSSFLNPLDPSGLISVLDRFYKTAKKKIG